MADLNEIRLIGRLTRDPVLKIIPSGMATTTFGLATGRKFKDQTGAWREETTFVDITCWNKTAENVSRYLKKGSLVFVSGRLHYNSWEDKQSGQKRSKFDVVADSVQFLDSKSQGQAQNQERPQENQSEYSQYIQPLQLGEQDNSLIQAVPIEPEQNNDLPQF